MADRYDPDILLAYVEGELAPEDRARVEAQLAEDTELRRLVEQLAGDRQALRDLPRETPPPGLVDDAIQQLERQMLLGAPADEPLPFETPARPPRRHRVLKPLAYSALAAVVLLSGGLIVLTLVDMNIMPTAERLAGIGQGGDAAESADRSVALRQEEGQQEQPRVERRGLVLDAPGGEGRGGDQSAGAAPAEGEEEQRSIASRLPSLADLDNADQLLDERRPNVDGLARGGGERAPESAGEWLEREDEALALRRETETVGAPDAAMLDSQDDPAPLGEPALGREPGGADEPGAWAFRPSGDANDSAEGDETPSLRLSLRSRLFGSEPRGATPSESEPDAFAQAVDGDALGTAPSATSDAAPADPSEVALTRFRDRTPHRVQVQVVSADAHRTRAEVMHWVASNSAAVLPSMSDADFEALAEAAPDQGNRVASDTARGPMREFARDAAPREALAAERDSDDEGRVDEQSRRRDLAQRERAAGEADRVADDDQQSGPAAPETPDALASNGSVAPHAQQVRIRLEQQQLPELVAYLNRDAHRQQAQLMLPVADDARVARVTEAQQADPEARPRQQQLLPSTTSALEQAEVRRAAEAESGDEAEAEPEAAAVAVAEAEPAADADLPPMPPPIDWTSWLPPSWQSSPGRLQQQLPREASLLEVEVWIVPSADVPSPSGVPAEVVEP